MDGLREILVALPHSRGDIYRRHQLVWRAMHGRARQGSAFLFAEVSPHLVRVRSSCLERGSPSSLAEGIHRLQLVTARRDGLRMTVIPDADVTEWVSALLDQHGLRTCHVELRGSSIVTGIKRDRITGKEMNIQLPVKDLLIDVSISHRAKANLAWAHGIGRGKRFGFGMLQRAE